VQQFQEFSELWACRHQALCLVLSGIVSWMILSAGYLASPQACLLLSPVVVPRRNAHRVRSADATNPTRSQLQALHGDSTWAAGKKEATRREEELQSPTARESNTHKKTPTRNSQGQPTQAAAPSPRKDVSALAKAGLLAYGIDLLSAPSRDELSQWFPQISFRSQLRGSDGFAPSSLVTISGCDQPFQRCV